MIRLPRHVAPEHSVGSLGRRPPQTRHDDVFKRPRIEGRQPIVSSRSSLVRGHPASTMPWRFSCKMKIPLWAAGR